MRPLYQENRGVSSARNTGLEAARGRYVVFCDVDDSWDPTWLAVLCRTMSERGADSLSASFTFVDEEGIETGVRHVAQQDVALCSDEERLEFLVCRILNGEGEAKIGWEVCSRLFVRSIIEEHCIRFCESCGDFAEDLGFTLEYLLYCKKVSSIDFAGYRYTQHLGSMMGRSESVLRVDSLNEVSRQLVSRIKGDGNEALSAAAPVFHYMLMWNQYRKVDLFSGEVPALADAVRKVGDWGYYKSMTEAIGGCRGTLRRCLGKQQAQRALILSDYCVGGRLVRYRIRCFVWLGGGRRAIAAKLARRVLGNDRYGKLRALFK